MIYRKNIDDKYFVMDNESVQSDKLSFKAKGILACLMSRPLDWNVTITSLAKLSPKEGVDSIRTGLKELEEHGLAALLNVRQEDGTFKGTKWFVSNDPAWIADLKKQGEIIVSATNKVIDHRHADEPTSVKSYPLDNPSLGSSNATNKRYKQSTSKSHSLDSVESGADDEKEIEYDQCIADVISKVYDWLKENDLLKGKAKKLTKEEVTFGTGPKDKGWYDVVEKIIRLDGREIADIDNTMEWLMYTADDYDGSNPQNGAFWLDQAGWCSMATLRKKSRGNNELTQFDQMHSAFTRWNKRRKKS